MKARGCSDMNCLGFFFSLSFFFKRLRLKCCRVRLTNPEDLGWGGRKKKSLHADITREFSIYQFDGSLLGGADVWRSPHTEATLPSVVWRRNS